MKVKRIIIIPDTHLPWQDDDSLRAVERFMADYAWDEWVHLGDLLDFDMISSFNAEDLRELETRRMIEDYNLANSFLDRQQKIVRKNNPKAKFTLLEGNHEHRIERLINKTPQLEGLLEVSGNLRLKARKIKWVRSWSENELYEVGKLNFAHGLYTNKYHASKMVDIFGVNIVYGHTHDMMSHVKTVLGKDKIIMAQSLGHLADEHKLSWMQKRPSNWVQGFGVAEVRPDGNFTLHPIIIINNTFSYNGVVYDGKKNVT